MTVTAETAPAAIAEPVALVVDVAEAESGTVTLLRTADGWEIRGVHRTRTVNGKPATSTFTIRRCDCREAAQAKYARAIRDGGYRASFAHRPRPLCPLPFGASHGGAKCRDYDHCYNRGHEERVCALFADIVKTYGKPVTLASLRRDLSRTVAQHRPSRLTEREIDDYTHWRHNNAPDADDPFGRDADLAARKAWIEAAKPLVLRAGECGHKIHVQQVRRLKAHTVHCSCGRFGGRPGEQHRNLITAERAGLAHVCEVLGEPSP